MYFANRRWLRQGVSRKGLKSLVILVCWEIWNERNARIFNSTEAPSFAVTEKKGEASAWILTGAKHLARLIGRACVSSREFECGLPL
jgi:hypothetical protein